MTQHRTLRASDADRDQAVEQLNSAVAIGQLTFDEHERRTQAALSAASVEELSNLTSDLTRSDLPRNRSRGRWFAATLVAIVAVAILIVAVSHNDPTTIGPSSVTATSGVSAAVSSSAANAVPPSPMSPAVNGVTVRTVAPGAFGKHDPADECGAFGTATTVGGSNCYVVVQFANASSSPVTFAPADLRMVDQTGDTYSLAPVLPACYDTVDINALQNLKPNARLTVQLCFPVMTGAMPETMLGTRSLTGLTLTVPASSIVGTWGGA